MISIVVPVYNGEKYIEDCIKSILKQTYTEWELLLIDNDSLDHTLKICKEYAKTDDRIQVLHQHKNRGVSVARNLGLERAAGEYITFIDCDDWIEPDYLEQLLWLQEKEEADMVLCEYHKAYDADREKLKAGENNNALETAESQNIRGFTKEAYIEHYFLAGNTHCWGVLFDVKILEDIHFPKDITIGEDMMFMLEVSSRTDKIVVTDYKGYYYYINENGAMNQSFLTSYMDQITCWERARQIIEKCHPGLLDKTESIILISILLVVGKISCLEKEKRQQYIEEENKCYDLFMKYAIKGEVVKCLDLGYKLKSFIYSRFPKVYVFLYGLMRGKKR